jgi:hypothetical protein
MTRSISIESSSRSRGLPSSVCVVRPEPNPMLAMSCASGFIASGNAAARIMVDSSAVARRAGSRSTLASGLPLVRIERMVLTSTTEIVAVFPSR